MPIAITISLVVLAVVAAGVAFIATRPADFRVERTARVDAPPGVVFGIINELRRWSEWSPYDKRDPAMKRTFDGPASGPGAAYAWSGNSQVGEGRMTILESKPGELVAMRLEFVRPFVGTNRVEFRLAPAAPGTAVTWHMAGRHDFMGKAMSVFMNMDAMIGKDFEQGLANLNTAAQTETGRLGPHAPSAGA